MELIDKLLFGGTIFIVIIFILIFICFYNISNNFSLDYTIGFSCFMIGIVFFIISTSFIKTLDIGFIYLTTIQLSALVIPSVIGLYISNPKFNILSCFKGLALYIGIADFIYYLLSGISYILLPLSISIPIFFLWPIMRRLIGIFDGEHQGIHISTTIVLFVGICCFIYSGLSDLKNNNIYHTIIGLICGLIGMIGITVRWYTTPILFNKKEYFTNKVKNKQDKYNQHKKGYKEIIYNSFLAETYANFLPFICFLFLSICLYLTPTNILNKLKKLGIPNKIINTKTNITFTQILITFGIFILFSLGAQIGYTVGALTLSYDIYTALAYTSIIVSGIIGFIRLNESVDTPKKIGYFIILFGIIFSLYNYLQE